MLTSKHVNHEVYVAVLRRLPAGAAQPVSLVMDGHSVHRSGAVKPFAIYTQEWRRLFFLSPCPPEENPDEQVRNLPHEIRSFFEHPGARSASGEAQERILSGTLVSK